jgi:hypothetical protein
MNQVLDIKIVPGAMFGELNLSIETFQDTVSNLRRDGMSKTRPIIRPDRMGELLPHCYV